MAIEHEKNVEQDKRMVLRGLLEKATGIDEIKGQLIERMDTYNDGQVEAMIASLQKAADRLKRIEGGDTEGVLKEFDSEKIKKIGEEMQKFRKEAKEKEEVAKVEEQKILDDLIKQLDSIS